MKVTPASGRDWYPTVDSNAGGMAIARPQGFRIDFVRNLSLDQLHDFSLLSLKSFLPCEISRHQKYHF